MRYKYFLKILLFMALMFSFMIFSTNSIYAASKYLSVSSLNQEKSQWCWVAAPQIIIKYHTGSLPSQCTLVKRGKNINNCPNQPGTLTESRRAMSKSGISNTGNSIANVISYQRIKSNINNNRPVILRKAWKDSNGKKTGTGHLAVIYGFYDSSSSDRVGILKIRSSSSFKTTVPYSDLINNSSFVWTNTVYNINL